MSVRKFSMLLSLVITLCLVVLCGCEAQPEFYNPYGEGVDPNSVTTGVYERKPTATTTGLVLATTVATTSTTAPTRVAVPMDGYITCPDCDGIMIHCEYCRGTKYRLGEMYDPDSGAFRKYKIKCDVCVEDPGFVFCKTCQNTLMVPAN